MGGDGQGEEEMKGQLEGEEEGREGDFYMG